VLHTRCPYGVEAHVASSLCLAITTKLDREMASRLNDETLFCHALTEAISCERELRGALNLSSPNVSVLRAFTSHAVR